MLEEQAHEAKRQQLLERAAIVKKRMEAQGRAGESVRKSRFDVMADRKYTKSKLPFNFNSFHKKYSNHAWSNLIALYVLELELEKAENFL